MNSSQSDDPALDAGLAAAFAPDGTGAYQSRGETAEAVGTIIAGKYKLLELIGEGGMGSVWMAQQTEPVKRLVAVKLIKTGMDSKTVLARFEAERQALAVMDHPNIAKILDGGITNEPPTPVSGPTDPLTGVRGSPFFVMELVKGVPITKYCDANKLTPKQRLELFVPVCQAIQHAHQKGIIHRDIKPSNVIVALYDDKPVPKVIDFGVAKATGQSLTKETLHTGFGGIVGTPEYLSPEQATLNNLDIDTRSDIYSLGVLLYELLAGSPPFKHKELEKAGLLEMLRVIREDEPPRPSMKLSTADALPSLSANRGTEPKKLTGILRNELDWIVMKALEKDRSRRYETANGFAADINRYLAGEPVNAHPPSGAYRMRKFLRKHKGPVIAASLVGLALVLGIIGTSIGLSWADRERGDAIAARNAETEQKSIAEAERRKAENAEDATLKDFEASTNDAIFQLIGSKATLGEQEKAYLRNTLERWKGFANRFGDDERSQKIRAEGHFNVAGLWLRLGRWEEARVEYDTAREIQQKLVAQFLAVPDYQDRLAVTRCTLGAALTDLRKWEEARVEILAAREILRKLIARYPDQSTYWAHLADTHNNLGTTLTKESERDAARVEYMAARDIRKKLVAQFPNDAGHQEQLAMSHENLGVLLRDLEKLNDAQIELLAAGDLWKKLAKQKPDEPRYRLGLASNYANLAMLFHKLSKPEGARVEYRAARDIAIKLVEQFPSVPEYQRYAGGIHFSFAEMLLEIGNRDEARTELEAARDVRKRLAKEFPLELEYQLQLARTHTTLATLLLNLKEPGKALTEFQTAQELLQKLADRRPVTPEFQFNLGSNSHNIGTLLREQGKLAESLEYFSLAIKTLDPFHEKVRDHYDAKQVLCSSYAMRADSYFLLKKFAEASRDWDRAVALAPTAERFEYCLHRAGSKILARMDAESLSDTTELMKSEKWTSAQWFKFADLLMNVGEKAFDDAAMQLLQKAVKEGFNNADELKKNKKFAPLREREDFKKLVVELESKSRPD